jgi:hypothetical protein
MFCARVQVGKYAQLKENDKLKMPPLMNEGTDKLLRYDSVKGNTKNCDVYMVYNNKKAYPEYLITYK